RRAWMMFGALTALAWMSSSGAFADSLFRDSSFASLASDQRASNVGDILTVVVYQTAEARNAAQNAGGKERTLEGSLSGGSNTESGSLALSGDYRGRGEIRRSESFITQISVSITEKLANGDFRISGQQNMFVNGEETTIHVRGRVRPVDITRDNQVLSTRIADAEINYDGEGFVSRNARPGLIQYLFGLLGLGG
ncbi:MAG: flagellar basal body L-ring protein FlgH, partial [Caulobacterales bacterium]